MRAIPRPFALRPRTSASGPGRPSVSTTDPPIAFIGTLSGEKRIDLAIAAIAKLPDHVLVVAGDGPLRHEAERQAAAEAPGRVMFLGEVRDVIPILHAVDAVVITSEAEGMPGVAIEAALCGLPVVATDGRRPARDAVRHHRRAGPGDPGEAPRRCSGSADARTSSPSPGRRSSRAGRPSRRRASRRGDSAHDVRSRRAPDGRAVGRLPRRLARRTALVTALPMLGVVESVRTKEP